ncbi:hypothetical protein AA14362_2234 [Acetobacter cerevisiae DSM 14362]|nr:hypothetical protein AA14362_2234 [Acetobacter cerevisiae DSM 14362]
MKPASRATKAPAGSATAPETTGASSMEATASTAKTTTAMHSAATSPTGMCQSYGRQRAGKKQARGQPSVMK